MALIKFFASLRNASGVKEATVQGATIGEVIAEAVKQYPGLSSLLLEDGQVRPHVVVTINGQPTKDMEAAVTAQDLIAIFPPIAGG